ncbi:DDB1- and CUL4-associated factor 4 isoform X2 [Cajanus cajan]|uniref:DDB1- and CUL4-associated factor 4 isoform X2 n=1 Tax=Cajanus cajan TaxID=3821 RepID=UPI0010FB6192|nr:DDB1- and CUL4-associated factor 4 isoform X2 [Cajanus cajan]
MPEARELPGFYYDPEKNRYFPIKGPIPGSSSKPKTPQAPSKQESGGSCCRKLRNRTSKLLQARELDGHRVIASHNCKRNIAEEFRKIHAAKPVVWKFRGADKIGISAMEHLRVDVQTRHGQSETDVLLTGNINGSLSFSEVGKVGQYFDGGAQWMADCVKNYDKGKTVEQDELLGPVFRPNRAALLMPSRISCIRLGPNCSSHAVNGSPIVGHALFTTLGSETSGGSVYTIGFVEPLDLGAGILNTWSRLEEIASFRCTLWTAEYDYNRHQAVIGTNMGGASVNLETGITSWFLHCKSDVFAQQIVNSGNVILCGLRNGAIVTVDFREKRERLSGRLITHRIPYTSSDKKVGGSNKEWFKLKGDINPSHTIRMPSSISSLVSLQDEQYFLASSMDGSMRLYDHRLLQRGAVQYYEGHVNSHTRIQMGVDPTERFVMSGGEDCKLRLWSIKSGELLFEDKFSDSVLSAVCYKTCRNSFIAEEETQYKHDSSIGAWLGSHEGLFYMNWL